ncbi:MAG: GGDEF domain-containing phosphodiesterase [Ruminococcus sp.]|nr:GGDEF domain-containing phosphodiesterase [Ruminococcus sp.]
MKDKEYLIAFNKFLKSMKEKDDTLADDAYECITDLCDVMRIGRIEVSFFDTPSDEYIENNKTKVFYDIGNYDETIYIIRRNNTVDDRTVVYKAWIRESEAAWDDIEKERVNIILDTLFVFNSRSRFIQLADKLLYFDYDMDTYNHKYYMRYLNKLIVKSEISQYTAIYFNLKKFSVVNQQIGRKNGTKVMHSFINTIVSELESGEILARIGGDNFTLIVKKGNQNKILNILNGIGIFMGGSDSERVFVSANAGIYEIPDNSVSSASDVMDRISVALHIARQSDKLDFVYFDDKMLEAKKKANAISAYFPTALKNREFLVYYQPKVTLDGYKLAGAEALCRWKHDGQLIPPFEFISVLERSMDICKLDFYMLDRVCSHLRKWLDEGKKVVRISVNLSRRHLSDMDLTKHILEIIDSHNVPHELIELELTETITDYNFQKLTDTITSLQENGLYASVDDFGVGYSSINLIKEVPWNVLKIDKSLLPSGNGEDKYQNKVMLKYVVAMAQAIGLECVAEGVETPEQIEILRDNCCDFVQGYIFDKPMPVEEFEQRLDNYKYTI